MGVVLLKRKLTSFQIIIIGFSGVASPSLE